MLQDIIHHYDLLIDENNDPVHDPEKIRICMDHAGFRVLWQFETEFAHIFAVKKSKKFSRPH